MNVRTQINIVVFLVISFINTLSAQQKNIQLVDGKTRFTLAHTNVSIIPPAYFRSLDQQDVLAFLHPGSFSSIQVKRIEGIPYYIFTESITEDVLKNQGVTLLEKTEMQTYAGKPGMLVRIGFTMKTTTETMNIEFERLMFFTGTYNETIWIDATYPLEAKNLLYNVLLHSILSIEF